MKLPPRTVWIPAAVSFVLLAVVFGSDLVDAWRVRVHEVSAMPTPPKALFAAGTLLFALGAGALFLQAAARHQDATARAYRMLPILGVVALFVDLFVLVDEELAAPAAHTARAARAFADALHTPDGALERDPGALSAIAQRLGAPQYLVNGKRPEAFRVEVRAPCDGPADDRGSTPAGTLLVCFSGDARRAWVSAVTLPHHVRFGAPQMLTIDGTLVFATATARAAAEQPTGRPLSTKSVESDG